MKRHFQVSLLYIAICIAVISLLACSVVVKGKIVVKGNEPHSYPVLVSDDYGDLKIVGKLQAEIRQKYQNRQLVVEGTIVKKAIGPGMPAEFEVTKIVSTGMLK